MSCWRKFHFSCRTMSARTVRERKVKGAKLRSLSTVVVTRLVVLLHFRVRTQPQRGGMPNGLGSILTNSCRWRRKRRGSRKSRRRKQRLVINPHRNRREQIPECHRDCPVPVARQREELIQRLQHGRRIGSAKSFFRCSSALALHVFLLLGERRRKPCLSSLIFGNHEKRN